jgi:ElaB/YqjD/DUF883 family membrane-anchored ribosome-binding protein
VRALTFGKRTTMTNSTFEELAGNLRGIRADAEALLKTAAESAGDRIDAAGESALDSLQRVCEHLRSAEDEVSKKAHALDRLVRANAWQAIAATGVIAFLLGMLVRRR